MQIVYFSHSYRPADQVVNDFFSRLAESEGLVLSLDPPSATVNVAKLQRHLNSSDGMIAVLTRREGGVSPYIRFEADLCLRSRKPLLVFVEDLLPGDLVPPRILQRRFSRQSFLRQVREHRHALRVFTSYLGEEPAPRYQPDAAQRACVLVGDDVLEAPARDALRELVVARGYRALDATDEALAQTIGEAHVAFSFLDTRSGAAHYVRGLLRGASVPTIELTTDRARAAAAGVPAELAPLVLEPAQVRPEPVCELAATQLSVAEEDFLDLPDQDKVDAYFRVLVDVGEQRGDYSTADHERVVKVVMGDEYTVGQAGAVGPGSHAHDMTFVQRWDSGAAGGDTEALAAELAALRKHLREQAGDDPEHDLAIAALAGAEVAAKEGNGPEALQQLSALQRLKGAAEWVLGTAAAIGTTVATAAIKSALGV